MKRKYIKKPKVDKQTETTPKENNIEKKDKVSEKTRKQLLCSR